MLWLKGSLSRAGRTGCVAGRSWERTALGGKHVAIQPAALHLRCPRPLPHPRAPAPGCKTQCCAHLSSPAHLSECSHQLHTLLSRVVHAQAAHSHLYVIFPLPCTPALLTGSCLLLSTLGASSRLLYPISQPLPHAPRPSHALPGLLWGQLGLAESSRVASLT